MKKLIYNYLKPAHYYNRLLLFFAVFTLSITIILFEINMVSAKMFFLNFIIIYFILITFAAAIEFMQKGEYMDPLEIYDVENFFTQFNKLSRTDPKTAKEKYFNKYDLKSKKNFDRVFHKKRFLLSSIKKNNNVFEITFFDEKKLIESFFLKFLIRGVIHKVFVKNIKGEYKIIRIT